jgi:hypothetical protein
VARAPAQKRWTRGGRQTGFLIGGLAGAPLLQNVIVTRDEGGSGDNHIATIFSGQPVKPGNYPEPTDHYRLLRTLQDIYGLTPTAHAAQRQPITDVWR